MAEMLLISAAMLAGVDFRALALLAAALLFPVWALAACLLHVVRNRTSTEGDGVLFCQAVARELRAGATLRDSLHAGALLVDRVDLAAAIADSGRLGDVSSRLSAAFPELSPELGLVVGAVSNTGTAAAPLFEELGDVALATVELSEEVRVATAPARASALVLIGLPLAFIAHQTSTGRIGDLLATPGQRLLALTGLALVVVGLVLSIIFVRRVS